MQFWKKLRLIKKCEHCREKGTHSLIISHNLIHKYNIINQKVYDTFSIDWYLKKSEAKKKFLKNDAPPEDSSLKKKIK